MKKQGLYQLLIGALAVAPLGCDKKSERAIRAEAVANSQASAEPPAISVVEVPQTSGAASAEASVVQAVKPRPVEKSQPPARQRAPVPPTAQYERDKSQRGEGRSRKLGSAGRNAERLRARRLRAWCVCRRQVAGIRSDQGVAHRADSTSPSLVSISIRLRSTFCESTWSPQWTVARRTADSSPT